MSVKVGEYGDRAAAVNILTRIATAAQLGLESLTFGADEIAGMVQTARDGFDEEAAETTPDLVILAGYVQSIIERPSLVTTVALDDRFEAYSDLSTELLALLDDITIDGPGFNRALCVELAFSSVLYGLAVIVQTGQPDTRSHALSVAWDLLSLFETAVEALDTAQEAFEDQPMDSRYFSQTATYTVASNLVVNCVKYLLISAYNLKIEKRFTLKKREAPVMIAISEYGDMSIDDAFDLFIKANSLSGIELLLLEAGREVVVYV